MNVFTKELRSDFFTAMANLDIPALQAMYKNDNINSIVKSEIFLSELEEQFNRIKQDKSIALDFKPIHLKTLNNYLQWEYHNFVNSQNKELGVVRLVIKKGCLTDIHFIKTISSRKKILWFSLNFILMTNMK